MFGFQDWCESTGTVCGHDGESYQSECAARAAGITVDYKGQCRAVGNIDSELTEKFHSEDDR
jgi:hypothetical protein